jgi:hypothetical protein
MLRLKLFIITVGLLALSCSKVDVEPDCIKGKLVINGICGNTTIQVLSGNINTNLISKSWEDPITSIKYENVFALQSTCTFPDTLKEGDEFYFVVYNDPKGSDCMRCLAYRPVPPKGLMIRVCK